MRALLVSKHEKEQCLNAAFSAVGIELESFTDFDTDKLGTFSGTVTRTLAPLEAAKAKALAGIAAKPGFDWYIGSEGSFFPDPAVPFITRQHELLLAIANPDSTPIVAELSNLVSWPIDQEISDEKAFLQLIEGAFELGEEHLFLGLPGSPPAKRVAVPAGREALLAAYRQISNQGSWPVQALSDLRAHRSKSRRKLIEDVAVALAAKLTNQCPKCHELGFGLQRVVPGLPCAWCLNPTSLPKSQRFVCPFCHYWEEKPIPGSPAFADPGNCGICNP